MHLGIKPDDDTLYYASSTGNLELVMYLIGLGIKPNDYTLEFALESGNLELVEYLKTKL